MFTYFNRINAKAAIQVVVLLASILCTSLIFAQQSSAQPDNSSFTNKSPEEMVSQMRTRLHLTDEQVSKIRPIIEESINKRADILNNNGEGKATKSALQQLQWTTDMKLGQVLSGDQMDEYQTMREEQTEKTTTNDAHHGKGGRGGGMRGL